MPELSRFYGIVITMYHNDHPPAHFHIRYAGQKAKMALETLALIDGRVPNRVRALAVEWATLHVEELRANWELARAQLPLRSIAPLE